VRRRTAAVLFVCSIALAAGSCSSDDPSVAGSRDTASGDATPCDLLREGDAAELLGGKVERIDFAEYLRSKSTVSAQDQAQVEAASKKICMYRVGGSDQTVALQLDRGIFKNEEEFRSAFGPDVEVLDEPGLAATYRGASGVSGGTHFGVLLNAAGDSFDLAVTGVDKSKAELQKAATQITSRY